MFLITLSSELHAALLFDVQHFLLKYDIVNL